MRGLALVVLAAVCWGLAGFVSKLAVGSVSAWTAAVVRSAVFFPVVAGFVLSQTTVRWNRDRPTAYAIGAGVAVGLAVVSTRLALTVYEVSLVSPIRRLNVLVTVLLSVLVLEESMTGRKAAGIAAAVGAIILLGQ